MTIEIKHKHQEPDTIEVDELNAGDIFKTPRGQGLYMVVKNNGANDAGIITVHLPPHNVLTVCLHSGKLYSFAESHEVVEYAGTLEIERMGA